MAEQQKKNTFRAFGEFLLKALGFGIGLFILKLVLPPEAGRLVLGFAALSAILFMIWVPKQKYFNQRSTYAALLVAVMFSVGSSGAPSGPVDPTLQKIAENKKMQEEAIRDETTRQQAWIAQGQESIKKKLKDPSSAKFQNVYFSKAGGAPVACGEVSSKNSYGGYAGFQRFVAAGDGPLAFLENEVEDFAHVWNEMCVSK